MRNPRLIARIAGVLYFLTIAGGVFSQLFITDRLIAYRDATLTANNILAHPSLFELGFSAYLIEMTCQIAVAALFYVLLKPVNRAVAVTAAFLNLAGSVIKTLSRLFYIAPLFVLSGKGLTAFNTDQLRALSLLLLKVNNEGAALSLPFLGLSAFLTGYLIFRSTFLPRALGIFICISSIGWLTFFYPPLGHAVFVYVAVLALLASAVHIFWFVVIGVDEGKWRQRQREDLVADGGI